ncbi:hypothetical protein FJZ48_00285 [Candidatus Uhrbacteria bacterium]|nr:hypothetical protein [Candidatus Uhrbacteria bacterium]
MSDEHRVVFSRGSINGYRGGKTSASIWRRTGIGCLLLILGFIILFVSGSGCVFPKKEFDVSALHITAEDVIVLRPTILGIKLPQGNKDRALYASGTRSDLYVSFETFSRLNIDGEALVNSDLEDSFVEKIVHRVVQTEDKDPNLVIAEPELVTYSLRINGKRVSVPAIHAKGERQELIILHSPNTPLILKRTRNPLHRSTILAKGNWKQNIQGHQITDLMVSGYK